MASLTVYGPWFVDRLEYCACDYNFKMRVGMNHRMIKTFVE